MGCAVRKHAFQCVSRSTCSPWGSRKLRPRGGESVLDLDSPTIDEGNLCLRLFAYKWPTSHSGRAGQGAPASPSLQSPFPPEGSLPSSRGILHLPAPRFHTSGRSCGVSCSRAFLLPASLCPQPASSLGCWLGSRLGPTFFLSRLRSARGSQHLGSAQSHLAWSLSCVFPPVLWVRALTVACC